MKKIIKLYINIIFKKLSAVIQVKMRVFMNLMDKAWLKHSTVAQTSHKTGEFCSRNASHMSNTEISPKSLGHIVE